MVLHISGRITGQNVDTLRAALEQEGKTVAVDLRDALLVDGEAVRLLALTEANGTESKIVQPMFVNGSRVRGPRCTQMVRTRTDDGV